MSLYAAQAGVKRIDAYTSRPGAYRPRRRVGIVVFVCGHAPDTHNLYKHLLDGMKRAFLLVDDSDYWCNVAPVVLVRVDHKDQEQTVITITDL